MNKIAKIGKVKMIAYNISKNEFQPVTSAVAEDVINMRSSKNCIDRPIDSFMLAKLADLDPTHRACIDKKTNLVAGLGYKVLSDKSPRKLKKFTDFAKNPNNNQFESLTDIFKKTQEDFEIYDDAFVEFIKRGDAVAMYHLSAKDMYIEPNKHNGRIRAGDVKKFWQIHKENGVQSFDPYTGGKLVSGKHYVAQLKGYSSSSSFYGVPKYISSYPAMIENILIRQYGMNFFKNDARPSIAILISGGSMNEQTEKNLQTLLQNEYKSVENSHRVLVISVDDREAKVDIKEISKSIDGNFLKEYEKNRDEIGRTHDVPPKILGISSSGSMGAGSETIGSLKQFIEETINPRQLKSELFFNSIFEVLFDVNPEIKLNTIDLTNAKDDAVIESLLAKIEDTDGNTATTVEEIREKFHKPKKLKGAPIKIQYKQTPSKGTTEEGETVLETKIESDKDSKENLDVDEKKD